MKKLTIILVLFSLVSCGPSKEEIEQMEMESLRLHEKFDPEKLKAAGYKIVVIDGCEYIKSHDVLTHKGNCKSPFHNHQSNN